MQEKGDAALGSAAGADSFSPHADCPSALCFFVSSFLCFFSIPLSPLPRSWSKESADTSAAARPPLSALFYFSCERVGCGCLGGAGWNREQERRSERERMRRKPQCPSPPSRLLSLTSTSCPLLSHHADLHPSPSFPSNSPSFLPSFLSYLCLSFPCR